MTFSCSMASRFCSRESIWTYDFQCFRDVNGFRRKTPMVALFWYDLDMRFWVPKSAFARASRFCQKIMFFLEVNENHKVWS